MYIILLLNKSVLPKLFGPRTPTPLRSCWVSTREVNHGSSCFFDRKHPGLFVFFVDLTAAYDTVWHRVLTCNCLKLLPDRHMVRMSCSLSKTKVSSLLPVTTSKVGTPSEKRYFQTWIGLGSPLFQLLCVQPALHSFQKVYHLASSM